MKMAEILDCEMSNCSYNKNKECHAFAITVGSDCAMCDTFMNDKDKGGQEETFSSVGACRVKECTYNDSLECAAPGIHVGIHSGHPDCITYRPVNL